MKDCTPINFSMNEVAKHSEDKEQLRKALAEITEEGIEFEYLVEQVASLELKLELAEETRDKSIELIREIINGLKTFSTYKDLKKFITEKYEESGVEI